LIEELAQYNMIIQHRSGKKHVRADGLSRIPDELETSKDYEPGVELCDIPFGGCNFCLRARQQWEAFEKDVDCVVPLTIGRTTEEEINSREWVQTYTSKDLQEDQLKDPDIITLLNWIRTSHEPSKVELQLSSKAVRHFWTMKCQLILKNDILFYRWEDLICPRLLFIASRQMQEKYMHDCHDSRAAGHLGQYKTRKVMTICYMVQHDTR
jgi:hypothetical protein